MIEKHYSIKELGQLLSVSTKTIRRLLQQGTHSGGLQGISGYKKLESGIIRIPQSSIDRYLEGNHAEIKR